MKFIRGYKEYKEFRETSLNESILWSTFTCKATVSLQMKKAFDSFPTKPSPDSILNWVKSTILDPASPSFLVSPLLEELKASGGAGGKILPAKYHGTMNYIDLPERDYMDMKYYEFMEMVFGRQGGILASPDDIKTLNVVDDLFGQKIVRDSCGLFQVERMCEERFEGNSMPFAIIKYCVKRVRSEVAKQISFVEKHESRTGIETQKYEHVSPSPGGKTTGASVVKEAVDADPKAQGVTQSGTQSGTQSAVPEKKSGSIPTGCFLDTNTTNHISELKQLLIKVGFRDVDDPTKSPAERKKIYEPIIQKKRQVFYNYMKTSVYPKFKGSVDKIKDLEVEKYLESVNIDSTGKQTFTEEDFVLYLKKDKTMKDWKELKDHKKADLDDDETKEIASTGKVVGVEEDLYKIEFKAGEFTKKTADQIIKKIDKPEEEQENQGQKEEGQKEEEGQERKEKKNEVPKEV